MAERIAYDHGENLHGLEGPRLILPLVLAKNPADSLLDVGCGTGTWLAAATGLGVREVFGIDGIEVDAAQFRAASGIFTRVNLNEPWDLKRRFDLVLCLEVAEHLKPSSAGMLVQSLTRHADTIAFSAAIPGQIGQGHINCQWPDYWQGLFNEAGYACADDLRDDLWDLSIAEYWYKQNIFVARKSAEAGREPRIKSRVHPGVDPLSWTVLDLPFMRLCSAAASSRS